MLRPYLILLSLCLLTSVWSTPRLVASEEPAETTPPETEQPATPPPAPDPREQALATLAEAAATGSVASDRLLDLTSDSSAPLDLRNRAVLALAKIGLNDPQQAVRLFQVLPDTEADFDLRWTILMAFSSHTHWQEQLLPVLLQIVGNESQPISLRQQSWQNLRQQPQHPQIRKLALQLLATPATPSELELAALDLLKSGPQPSTSEVEELVRIAVLPSTPKSLQLQLLQTLAAWQSTARPAIPTLVTEVASQDAHPDIRIEAMRTLTAIGDIGPVTAYLAPVLLQTNAPTLLRQSIARLPELRNQTLPGTPAEWARLTLDDSQPLAARQLTLLALCSNTDSTAVETCRRLLLESQQDLSLRLLAADYLQQQPPADQQAWTSILERAEDENETQKLRSAALTILSSQSRHWIAKPGTLTRAQLLDNLAHLQLLAEHTQTIAANLPEAQSALESILQNQALLQAEWNSRHWDRLVNFVANHPLWTLLLAIILTASATYGTGKTKRYLQRPQHGSIASTTPQETLPPAVPSHLQSLLNELLATDNPERSAVVDKLRPQAANLDPAIPQLLETLKTHSLDLDVRYAALTALGLIEVLPDHAAQAVAQAVTNHEDPVFFRLKALDISTQNTRQPELLKTSLTSRITDSQESLLIRIRAGELLLTLGTLPTAVRNDLKKFLEDKPAHELQPILKKLLG